MNKKRNIAGLTVVVSNETYNEYKGTLQEQIDELQQRIDKAIENLFELKDMIYEPKTREINFDVQRKISETIKMLGDKE